MSAKRNAKAPLPATIRDIAEQIPPSFRLNFDPEVPGVTYRTLGFVKNAGDAATSISGLVAPQPGAETFDLTIRAKGLTADQVKRLVKLLGK